MMLPNGIILEQWGSKLDNSSRGMNKMKLKYMTTYDKEVWINKDDIINFLSQKGNGKKQLTEALESCYYKNIIEKKRGDDDA